MHYFTVTTIQEECCVHQKRWVEKGENWRGQSRLLQYVDLREVRMLRDENRDYEESLAGTWQLTMDEGRRWKIKG